MRRGKTRKKEERERTTEGRRKRKNRRNNLKAISVRKCVGGKQNNKKEKRSRKFDPWYKEKK